MYACALGAAEHEFSGAVEYQGWLSQELDEVLQTEVLFTDWHDELTDNLPGAEANLKACIVSLNDLAHVSRKEIAEWVGWLIDEQGYDLYVEVTPDCENHDQENEEPEPAVELVG